MSLRRRIFHLPGQVFAACFWASLLALYVLAVIREPDDGADEDADRNDLGNRCGGHS